MKIYSFVQQLVISRWSFEPHCTLKSQLPKFHFSFMFNKVTHI